MKPSYLVQLSLPFLQEDCAPLIGGQAVLEGVVMRNKERMAIAVRMPDDSIQVDSYPWFSLTQHPLMQIPFIRGFPAFLETLINGIKALNLSASMNAQGQGEDLKPWHLALCLLASLAFAVLLFVIMPHILSISMQWLQLGGGVEGLSFHLWDGLFKCIIFISYILLITLLPDIREVFRYHGAEHKVIRAFEKYGTVSIENAARCSRLHPRCGTTFLLFVLTIAIILHAIFVPLLFRYFPIENTWEKHILAIVFKLLLMVPIAALAYEAIRAAARVENPFLGAILRAPGLSLQILTTWEPKRKHLEVALASLQCALGSKYA